MILLYVYVAVRNTLNDFGGMDGCRGGSSEWDERSVQGISDLRELDPRRLILKLCQKGLAHILIV